MNRTKPGFKRQTRVCQFVELNGSYSPEDFKAFIDSWIDKEISGLPEEAEDIKFEVTSSYYSPMNVLISYFRPMTDKEKKHSSNAKLRAKLRRDKLAAEKREAEIRLARELLEKYPTLLKEQ